MDPLVYMSLLAVGAMALTLGASWAVGKFFDR
ncbi:hypothetical protein PMI01_01599 [Caulobacter sp. AP07]|nr:hypothetical protein PMI01_01599 [Caulobacter sp. AP07]